MTEIQDLLPLEDIEQRLALAAEIQDLRWRQAKGDEEYDDKIDRNILRLTTFDLSAIMIAPLDEVQDWLKAKDAGTGAIIKLTLLVRMCMFPCSRCLVYTHPLYLY
jgi:hypothetical protein